MQDLIDSFNVKLLEFADPRIGNSSIKKVSAYLIRHLISADLTKPSLKLNVKFSETIQTLRKIESLKPKVSNLKVNEEQELSDFVFITMQIYCTCELMVKEIPVREVTPKYIEVINTAFMVNFLLDNDLVHFILYKELKELDRLLGLLFEHTPVLPDGYGYLRKVITTLSYWRESDRIVYKGKYLRNKIKSLIVDVTRRLR